MRNFSSTNLNLFDSNNANLKLAVKTTFSYKDQNGQYRDNTYIKDFEINANPGVFIEWTCKAQDNLQSIYTSFPQMEDLREILRYLNEGMNSDAFVTDNGSLLVNPKYSQPKNILNIGKGNNWIQFNFTVCTVEENGTEKEMPAVTIELSTANRYVSVLTKPEFKQIYSKLMDLNLTMIQWTSALAFLNTEKFNSVQINQNQMNQQFGQGQAFQQQGYQQNYAANPNGYQNNGYQQNNYNQGYQNNQGYRNNGYQQNNQNGYQNNQGYRNNGYQQNNQQRSYQTQSRQPQVERKTFQPEQKSAPVEKQFVETSELSPFDAISSTTPIETISYDSAEEVDRLFADDAEGIFK